MEEDEGKIVSHHGVYEGKGECEGGREVRLCRKR
jgi:hypothetical protein